MRLAFGIRGVVATVMLALAAPALGDENTEEARRLYTQARKDFEEERYREAAEGFEAAAKLVQHAVALYTAAQAWERAGEPERAADAYARSLATPKLEEKQADRVRQRLAELEQELGTLIVTGEEGTRVQLGDATEVVVPATLHAPPGEPTLLVTRPDGSVERRSVKVGKGQRHEVDVSAPLEKPVEKPPEPVTMAEPKHEPVRVETVVEPAPVLRTVGFVTAGAGLGALGGALFLGLSANDAESTYQASPTRETFDHARSLESSTNVLLIAGGLLTAAGVGLVVWQSSAEKPETAAAGEARVRVRLDAAGAWAEGSF